MDRAGSADCPAGGGVLRRMGCVLKGRLAAAGMRAAFGYFRRAPAPRGGGKERVTIWKRSVLSGQLNAMELFVDPNALERWLTSSCAERPFLRDALPYLSDDEREFLLSGSTPDEWDMYFEDT